MAKYRDRMDDFKDTVHSVARSLEYSESKIAAILASFIIHKPLQKSPFMKAALKTRESIETLRQFISKHRKDYVDRHRSTEQERDNIEHEVSTFIKACKDQIDFLKNSITGKDSNETSRAWLGARGDNANADVVAHKHGVVLILSEQLFSVANQFDRLRSIRFQEAVSRSAPRRKSEKVIESKLSDASGSSYKIPDYEEKSLPQNARAQEQLLDDETQALQVELSNLLDSVQETETKMLEMSALNHLMSTHVLQQAQQIEHLYEQAVEATKNVERGNEELSQAIKRNSSSRTLLLLILFVLTFSILFLDWYN